MKRRVVIAMVLVVILTAGVPTALALMHAHTGLRDAEELAAHQLWPQVRDRLATYLWLHPRDAQARLLLADAFVKDDALPVDESARAAIECLANVPDSSPLAAEARFREGGFWFLLLQKPGRAEPLLHEAIDRGAGLKAHQLLWTLLNFTGRGAESEEVFWRVYELTPVEEHPLVLREWYLREFFPLSAQEALDRQMGILGPHETPNRTTESRRYLRFREREPESPASHAAIAQWCQEEGDPEFALRVLEAASKELPSAKSNRFFLSASIATHLDLGQFNEAEACFRKWPEGVRDQAYWKWRAIILDDVQGKPAEALTAYDQAIALWPGPADWGLAHRKAGCLARLRKAEEAARMKERAAETRALLRDDSQARVRAAVDALTDPEKLAEVMQFYRQLGRDREADAWQRYIQRLKKPVAEKP